MKRSRGPARRSTSAPPTTAWKSICDPVTRIGTGPRRFERHSKNGHPDTGGSLVSAVARAAVAYAPSGNRVLREPPILVHDVAPNSASERRVHVPEFKGVVSSLDELDRAASGRGLVSVLPNDGIVRRIPLLFDVNGTLAPALSVELLRVAQRAGVIQLQTRAGNVDEIAVGAWRAKAERDGAVRPYYSHADPRRFVSAVDVLDGKVDDERFRRKVVLIGVTGLGLVDYQNTPLREPMTGTEVQAQVIENLVDGSLLIRPTWARWPEMTVVLLFGA